MEDESVELAAKVARGNEQAAFALFDRYLERLLAMARQALSQKLAQRVDAEDVVQSAYRSFFVGARDGKYVIERGGDLWRLLARITYTKVQQQAEFHGAAKRSMKREETVDGGSAAMPLAEMAAGREPTPLDAAALADELEQTFRTLDPVQRRMVELRLQGYRLEEIAAETGRSERTVRRVIEHVRHLWQKAAGHG